LPRNVLDREIAAILAMGNVEFRGGVEIGAAVSFESLCADYDAVFIAMGEKSANAFGLEKTAKGLITDLQTYKTGREKVFAGGGAIGRPRFCVRAVADGKEAAISILHYLSGRDDGAQGKPYYHRLGQLVEGEMERFLEGAQNGPRCQPSKEGLPIQEAMVEAKRCLQCDCAKGDTCALRKLARSNQARQQTYTGQRKSFIRQKSNTLGIVFEPGKCILCGLCVQTAKDCNGAGLAFAGRGFKTEVAVPLHKILDDGLTKEAAEKCVEICPTGALAKMG
jgi:ferredoxin